MIYCHFIRLYVPKHTNKQTHKQTNKQWQVQLTGEVDEGAGRLVGVARLAQTAERGEADEER